MSNKLLPKQSYVIDLGEIAKQDAPKAVLEWREALRHAAPEPTPSEGCAVCGGADHTEGTCPTEP